MVPLHRWTMFVWDVRNNSLNSLIVFYKIPVFKLIWMLCVLVKKSCSLSLSFAYCDLRTGWGMISSAFIALLGLPCLGCFSRFWDKQNSWEAPVLYVMCCLHPCSEAYVGAQWTLMRDLNTAWCSLHFLSEHYSSVSHSLTKITDLYKREEIQFL